MRHFAYVTLFSTWIALGAGVTSVRLAHADDPAQLLRIDVRDKNPWTKLDLKEVPEQFEFAIVSEQTGENLTTLNATVDKLIELKPDFVLSVGDLSEGFSDDPAMWASEWTARNESLSRLPMPFFYCAGDHAKSAEMDAQWTERFGRSYFSFRLRDALFLVLDTDDLPTEGKPYEIGTAQQKWAIEEIHRHADARWTFIIVHHPIWTYDKKEVDPARQGWTSIEDALVGRQFTVIAGHLHEYSQKVIDGRKHIVVGKRADGDKSETAFDNIVTIKMTPDGPIVDGATK